MLQINSGKLYRTGVGRTNKLRGVLYTNLVLAGIDDKPVETEAGSLLPGEVLSEAPNAIVYELTEQLEGTEVAAGVLISHSVRPYLNDFAFIVSFALNVTCTSEHDLSARLLSGRRSKTLFVEPAKLIKRTFDKEVWCQPADATLLQRFVHELLGLRRKSFIATMKAIRTFVTGIHRVPDDLEQAYTLLVASIESLAQEFEGKPGTWEDYDDAKRYKLEKALEGATSEVSDQVKTALVEIEHLALARKFREFSLAHIPAAYFRGEGRVGALGRCDLEDALREAYGLRSRYVHKLQRLPNMLALDQSFSESMRLEHRVFLTLQGLAYLAREIIFEYVKREPKIEKEEYDYRLERFGILQAELSPEYWIGRPEGFDARGGRKRFEAFLQQLASQWLSKTPITNLRDLLPRIEALLPTCTKVQRRPLMALYFSYNRYVPEAERASKWQDIVQKYEDVLQEAAPEALITHLLFGVTPVWGVEAHHELYLAYFKQRNRKNGFRAPALFEAGMGLALVERYREGGNINAAKEVLAFATDNAPNNAALQTLAQSFSGDEKVDWGELLLPAKEN